MSIGSLNTLRAGIDDSPDYQREGGAWSATRQRLFLDSLLNGYDIPKLYFHDLSSKKGSKFAYAIIDGKQRLGTVWAFLEDAIPLDEGFEMNSAVLSDPSYNKLVSPPSGAQLWSSISEDWREVIKNIPLDVVLVTTDDPEEIEDLFFRLNNGEPLNAAEQRNNIRGSMTDLIRDVAGAEFFAKKLRIKDTRYKHREVAAKIVALEHASWTGHKEVCDLKKKHLDDLCRHNTSLGAKQVKELRERVDKELTKLCKVFDDRDPLLAKMATPPLYYGWVKHVSRLYGDPNLYGRISEFLREFEVRRIQNLKFDEDEQDPGLTEFTRLSQQATNDRGNLERRITYLTREFLRSAPSVQIKSTKRAFSDEERFVIFELGDRTCAECQADLENLDEMEADHVVQWSWGGPTSLDNARCLCTTCNASLRKHVK
jgi:hypothetical protein